MQVFFYIFLIFFFNFQKKGDVLSSPFENQYDKFTL